MTDEPAQDLRAIEEHLERIGRGEPLNGEVVQELQTTLEELRVADLELARQNDELFALHEAVAAEARRYQLLFDAAPVAYLATDGAGTIVDANEAAAALLGTESRFLRGKPLAIYLDLERRREFRKELLGLAPGGPRIDLPLRLRRRDGVAFDSIVSAVRIGGEVLWTIADQTALAQAESQLWQLNRELEARVSDQTDEIDAVLEQLPVGVAVLRGETVTRANGHAREIIDAVSVNRLLDHLSEHDGGTARFTHEGRVIEVDSVVIRNRAVVTLADVTHAAHQEQAERDFIANAAHQIRTPITVIASVVSALHAGGKDDSATLGRFLEHVDGAVARLSGVAEALLTLARIQRGAAAPARIVPLREVLDQAARDHGARIECEDDAATVADERLLVEAVSNVVDNAFAHGGGDVVLRAKRDGVRAVVEVRDHGPGIPASDRERVLERFEGRDSGLGLSIASEATQALGGTLELLDAEGGGLLVRFTLPGATLL